MGLALTYNRRPKDWIASQSYPVSGFWSTQVDFFCCTADLQAIWKSTLVLQNLGTGHFTYWHYNIRRCQICVSFECHHHPRSPSWIRSAARSMSRWVRPESALSQASAWGEKLGSQPCRRQWYKNKCSGKSCSLENSWRIDFLENLFLYSCLHLADARAHARPHGVAERGALVADEVGHAEVEAVECRQVSPRVQGLHCKSWCEFSRCKLDLKSQPREELNRRLEVCSILTGLWLWMFLFKWKLELSSVQF